MIHFSLIAPSIRPHLWTRFCDSLESSILNWEVIFVGPLPPVEKMPPNFRWIKTSVKPSQCTHIGFIEAKGEIVSLTADDAIYFSPTGNNAIDEIYNFIQNYPDDSWLPDKYHLIYGFRMFEDSFCGESTSTHYVNFVPIPSTTPLIYPFFAMYRSLYKIAGEYDNRFITGQAETDFQLRVGYKYGNTRGTLCQTAMVWANHDAGHNNKGKFREYHAIDSATLRQLWTRNNQLHQRQIEEVRPYDIIALYAKSQGECGEWI